VIVVVVELLCMRRFTECLLRPTNGGTGTGTDGTSLSLLASRSFLISSSMLVARTDSS
jgi:hypothetical protein